MKKPFTILFLFLYSTNGFTQNIDSATKLLAQYTAVIDFSDAAINSIAAGFTRKEIAELLDISQPLLKTHIAKLCKKFNALTHTDLANITIALGIAKLVTLYQKFD